MEQIKTIYYRLIKLKALYWLFGIMLVAHLILFIQYPFADGTSFFTSLGERMKSVVPYVMLITLLPAIHKRLDKIKINVINSVCLVFIALCVIYQIIGVTGQAWSTVAFSGLLILALFNHMLSKYKISTSIAFIFSFMIVWLGWVIFELIFQTGTWFYYPQIYDYTFNNFLKVIVKLIEWLIPALLFIGAVRYEKKEIVPRISIGNFKYVALLVGMCVVTTTIWFYQGMLIPLPVDKWGKMYAVNVQYLTPEHLQFSISRLSQISIMCALPMLFLKRGNKN